MEGLATVDRRDIRVFGEKRSRLFLLSTQHVGFHWIAQLVLLAQDRTPREGFRLGNRRSKDSSHDDRHRAVVRHSQNWPRPEDAKRLRAQSDDGTSAGDSPGKLIRLVWLNFRPSKIKDCALTKPEP